MGDVTLGLVPHLVLDDFAELALLIAAQFAIALGGYGVGAVARQLGKAFAFAGAGDQILGLLVGSRNSCGILAFGGDENLAQEYTLLADEFGFVLVVVFLQLFALDVHLTAHLLADDALGQHRVFDVGLEVLIRHAGLLVNIFLDLLRIRYLCLAR